MIQIDTGDTVFHRPTREEWLVACVQGDHLSWFGWPEGMARLADCLLVNKASPAEREKLLRDMAARDDESDHRVRYAQHRLAERCPACTEKHGPAECGPQYVKHLCCGVMPNA